ncbi:MAG: hypothetical protein HQK55_11890 [Deltaproteobacteria bacterium]|nr:hypothetical protein [Deltaproteobacteria bacterium]
MSLDELKGEGLKEPEIEEGDIDEETPRVREKNKSSKVTRRSAAGDKKPEPPGRRKRMPSRRPFIISMPFC